MKIVVIGAGHGGLQAAKLLAKNGYDITVYEKNDRDSLCYDWTDEVETAVFEELNIPLPQGHYHTDLTSLISPFSDKYIVLEVPEQQRDWTIERRPFAQLLADEAILAGAVISYNSEVTSLLFENGSVCGIVVNDKQIKADLVIDACGVDSPFRASLPNSYHIDKMPSPDDAFSVWRAYMSQSQGVKPPKLTKRIHLMLNGEPGISWCFYHPNGAVNILVGKTGGLSKETLERQVRTLKHLNHIIGDEIIRSGEYGKIPIRYPLSRMVGNGYAAVGDSAFMTTPMIGSGIANTLRAGQMLAEAIIKSNSVSVNALWQYQVRYYTEVGAEHMIIDMMKRVLLKTDPMNIRYIFESGIITQDDMKLLTGGDSASISVLQIAQKVIKCLKKPNLTLPLGKALLKGLKANKIAKEIPKSFDEQLVYEWQKSLDGCFK